MEVFFNKGVSKRLKSLLIILMFWGHMFNHSERLWNNISWKSLFYIKETPIEVLLCPFFHISVPLFFFIGGYGFFLTYKNGINTDRLKNQLIKLYKHYWLVFAIFIPICFLLHKLTFNPTEFILNLIGFSSSYCGEWWFLSSYVEILVLFWLIAKRIDAVLQNRGIKSDIFILLISIGIAVVGYGIIYVLGQIGSDIENIVVHEIYFILIKQPMFVVGFVCAKNSLFDKLRTFISGLSAYKKVAVFIILTIIFLFTPYISKIPETFIYVPYLPVFVVIFCYFDAYSAVVLKKFFEWMSQYTIYMWLCHSILLYKLIQPVIYLPKISVLCWLTLIFLSILCAIFLSFIESVIRNTYIKRIVKKNKCFSLF